MTRSSRLFSLPCAVFFAAGALLSAPVGGLQTLQAQEVLNGIAAVVNNQVITFMQVRELVAAQEESARSSLKGQALVDKIKQLRLNALNDLIDRQLILQEFKKMQEKGAAIPPHVIDEHVDAIVRDQFGNDRAAFIRTLAAQGFTFERFRQLEEEKIIVAAMSGQVLKGNGIVAEPKIADYYNKHIDEYTSEEQMHLRMLVLKKSVGQGDPRRRMMEEIREKIVAGAAFEDLARMYDEGSGDQENRGDWGWINRKTLNEELTKEAFALKPGQISRIIDMSGNYYLLYCEAKKGAVRRPLTEVRSEIEKKVLQESRQQQRQEWIKKMRGKAFIKIY